MRAFNRLLFRYSLLLVFGSLTICLLYIIGTKSHDVEKYYLTSQQTSHIFKPKNISIPRNFHEYKPTLDLMLFRFLEKGLGNTKVKITAEEFRTHSSILSGNPLIDFYNDHDSMLSGENGRGLTFVASERDIVERLTEHFQINVYASDLIPVNRHVPDSRLPGCAALKYEDDLPTASVIIPFYDEWPSILLRTVYSVINRTPRHLLQEIILIDDASTMDILKAPLDEYIDTYFPRGLVRLTHLPTRVGLTKARTIGWKQATGDVIVIFDSHMEVNIDWIQPLLTEIKKNRNTVAMGVLDYVNRKNFEYAYNTGYLTRYGFDWKLEFFETFFRPDQIGPYDFSPRPGTVMVGAAFAINRKYFGEIGGYDDGMKIWGGENLEMTWRIWLCGGRLVHLPCSHFGHIARGQPYSFPGGRQAVTNYNYKRAVEVWMGPFKRFVYESLPEMKDVDAGDISARLALKERLQCKNMTWFFHNIWPELAIYDENASAWGSARNIGTNVCLDNNNYLFQSLEKLSFYSCHFQLSTQGFSIMKDGLFKTTLQCVVLRKKQEKGRPQIEDCVIGTKDKWFHAKGGPIKHIESGLCMDVNSNEPIMKKCDPLSKTQLWEFNHYVT